MGIILVSSSIPEKNIWYTDRSMSEIDSSPESPKIPENWNFPERDKTDLKLVQIDPDARFLAFTLPDGRGHKSVEYFFNTEGEIIAYCKVPFFASISVGFASDCSLEEY